MKKRRKGGFSKRRRTSKKANRRINSYGTARGGIRL